MVRHVDLNFNVMLGVGPVGHDGVRDIPLKSLCHVGFTVRQDDVKLLL